VGGEKIYPALKVPSQCPLVLLVEASLREGKALGNGEGKGIGIGLYCGQRNEVGQGVCCTSEF
jgi:hypothetical protein